MRALTVAILLAVAAPASADDVTVKLLDAGKGPKQALRFTAKAGTSRAMTMTMQMTMAMDMGGKSLPPQKVPPIRVITDLKIEDVAANGDIRYTFVLRKPEVQKDASTPQATLDALKGAVDGMAGIKGHAVVSSRGFTKESDASAPAGASQQTQQMVETMRQAIAQISSPVPEEAVGVGAKWTTTLTLRQSGMTLEQSTTNELVELRGPRARIKTALVQTAKPQKVTTQGMTFDLESYKGSGSGEMQLVFPTVMPRKASANVHNDVVMSSSGTKIGMRIDMVMTATTE